MRLTSRSGLLLRAACSASINAVVLLVSLAIAGVVGVFVVLQFAPALLEGRALLAVLAAGGVGGAVVLVWAIPRGVRAERRQLLGNTYAVDELALDGADEAAATARRLALRADVTEPAVRVHTAWTPLAYTTYRPDAPVVRTGDAEPVIVVSRGVLDRLSADRREAVLAHEVAHLSNADLRLLSWLLVPLVAAEALDDSDEGEPGSLVGLLGLGLAWLAAAGVGVFTRGRELAADRGAAALTGDPAALAAALERLAETRNSRAEVTRPDDDLRQHAASTNAVNVLPSVGAEHERSWLASTHPPLASRLAQLRAMAAEGDDRGE